MMVYHRVVRVTGTVLMQMPPMKRARGGAAAVTMGGLLYVVGGSELGSLGSRGGECYLPALDSWHDLPKMADCRFHCTVKTFEGSLYCVGGAENWSSLNTAEHFDPNIGRWMKVCAPWSHSLALCMLGLRRNPKSTVVQVHKEGLEWPSHRGLAVRDQMSSRPQFSPILGVAHDGSGNIAVHEIAPGL
jgi:hypothetical protein